MIDTATASQGWRAGRSRWPPLGRTTGPACRRRSTGRTSLARFDDAGLTGSYAFQATACDNVGNCATSSERLPLPLRLASDSQVSLTQIVDPLRRRTVVEGQARRPSRDDQGRQARRECNTETCLEPRARLAGRANLQGAAHPRDEDAERALWAAGHPPRSVHHRGGCAPAGRARQDPRCAGQPFGSVRPNRRRDDGRQRELERDGPPGALANHPRGHRRHRHDPALQRSGDHDRPREDPARARRPARVPWGGTVHLVGQLLGGYLPPGGALVRLRIGYGSTYETYGVQEHVSGNGRFSTVATFGPGDPSILRTYWFQIASLRWGTTRTPRPRASECPSSSAATLDNDNRRPDCVLLSDCEHRG